MQILYVKEEDIPKTNTRKDFIRKFLRGKSYTSYYDENCTQIQCENGKFRSITELHQLTLSRFPVTSFEAVVRIVKNLIDEDANISLVWCTQVEKVVLKYYPESTRKYITKFSKENYYKAQGKDGYSIADYEKMLKNVE